MRLHRLTLQGVGPFLRPQTIDFDALAPEGLFLIDGPTGAGKTTIIDAIVYALYGELAGGHDAASTRLRCSMCAEEDPSVIELEFSVAGRRHIARRVPPGSRDPDRPRATSTGGSATLRELRPGQDDLVHTKVRDIEAHVEALLGMRHDQFTQLVVLPQGRFAELLRMRPRDRQSALQPLLDGDGLFRRVQDDLVERRKAAEQDRRDASAEVNAAGERLRGQLGAGDDEPEPVWLDSARDDVDRIASARAVLADLAERLSTAGVEREAADAERTTATSNATAAASAAAAISSAAAAQDDLRSAQSHLAAEDSGASASEVASRIADLTSRVGALAQHAEWEAAAETRAQERATLAQRAADLRNDIERATAERSVLPGRIAEARADMLAARELAATIPAARAAAEAAVDQRSAVLALANAEAALAGAEQALNEAQQSEERAHADEQAALAAFRELSDRQRAHRAALLAAGLLPGEACPVCGSPDHPHPAQTTDEVVSDDDVSAAGERDERCRAELAAAQETTRRAEAAATASRQTVLDLQRRAGGLTAAQAEEATSLTSARLAEAEGAGQLAADAQAAVDALTTRIEILDTSITDNGAQASSLEAEVTTLVRAEEQRRIQIDALIGDARSATALLSALNDRLDRLRAVDACEQAARVALAAVPDDARTQTVDQAESRAQHTAAQAQQAEARHAALVSLCATLQATLEQADPLVQGLAEALQARARVHAETSGIITLAAMANGENARRLPLAAYALMRRFESVLRAASEHLNRMSDGRFSLTLDSDVTQGFGGLGIGVVDAWSGAVQDAKALSGGETFYASLSLALGLADVVMGEAGGSPLETLFIDEGFGSLDQATLDKVMGQLERLRAGNRVVGVISHVTEMKDAIHSGITVTRRDDRTSDLRQSPP